LHLPKAMRRRITYVTVTVLATGGMVYALQHLTVPGKAQLTVGAAPAPEEFGTPGGSLSVLEKKQPQAVAAASDKATKTEAQPRPKVQTYKVQEGDTVEAIAARFGLKTDTILWSNDLSEDDLLQIDQEVRIPAMDGLVYEVQQDDTLSGIAADHGVTVDKIIEANAEFDPGALQPGQLVLVPGGEPTARRMVASRGNGGRSGSHKLAWPAWGPLTDPFGWRIHPVYGTKSFHDGMDIGVESGTQVAAAASGTVTMAERYGGYGLMVRLEHGGGLVTQYAHLSEFAVKVGQHVNGGELIGYSGNTGVSTGPHLHFMVIVDGSPVDPIDWLP
jgi:murein DD-endopeptidase MepM/ murein hydrolase activator NlpD